MGATEKEYEQLCEFIESFTLIAKLIGYIVRIPKLNYANSMHSTIMMKLKKNKYKLSDDLTIIKEFDILTTAYYFGEKSHIAQCDIVIYFKKDTEKYIVTFELYNDVLKKFKEKFRSTNFFQCHTLKEVKELTEKIINCI